MTDELLLECRYYIQNGGVTLNNAVATAGKRGLMDIDTCDAELYLMQNRDLTFTETLFAFIDRIGCRDSEVYQRAAIDRRLFSKIRSRKGYIPSKKTVIALCLALQLSRAEADRLLFAAGYSLSRADTYDLVISFCIERKIFNFSDINDVLNHFGFECF